MDNPDQLTPDERLELQQLLQLDFWGQHARSRERADEQNDQKINAEGEIPTQWNLIQGIDLHSWQKECVEAWFSTGGRGVLKVVTGAGKTILALAIAEKLQQIDVPNLRVAIVVPTIVLLQQWRDEFALRSNLPLEAIGLLGGGSDDTFGEKTRVLICVLNSAARKLPELVGKANVGSSLLLIVDECHRAGAKEMRRVFETERAFSLGLSATPERDDDIELENDLSEPDEDEKKPASSFDESTIGKELGPVIFELSYAEAIKLGVLPPFKIVHYGLNLLPPERANYDRISREITALRQDLERPGRRGLGLIRWCRSSAAASNPAAARLLALTSQRKRLLFRMSQRTSATIRILREAFEENSQTRAILFHESIDQVMELFCALRAEGFAVVAEHSEFPDVMRADVLHLFRKGTAQVIVSARSLIEGFNVPSADVGIIVAASSSVRQRVQTLGRLLRKTKSKEGIEKHASLYVLYAAETVDELIYEKADWEKFVGAERNVYFRWSDVNGGPPKEIYEPPRRPTPSELAIHIDQLQIGGAYPGDLDEGQEYTRDSQGTVRTSGGLLIEPHVGLAATLAKSKKTAGRFRVTPVKNFVYELEKVDGVWRGLYLGSLDTPVRAIAPDEGQLGEKDWRPGDAYPLARVSGRTFSILQRDPRLIAMKEKGRARFVVPAEQIQDDEKRKLLIDAQKFLKEAYGKGHRISKITVTKEGHVVYVFDNQAVFVGFAPEGPEGYSIEP